LARLLLVRGSQAVISLLALLLLVFTLVRLTGDPAYFYLPPEANRQQVEFVREQLGMNQPVPLQFVTYVAAVARGDLGISFKGRTLGTKVTDLVAQRVPNTLIMGSSALVLILAVGIPLGVYAGYWRGGKVDRLSRFFSALGTSVPSFWFGLLLILVFSVWMRILPSGGFSSPAHLILPAITLAIGAIAGLTRLLRSNMVEVMGADYIGFHRIKGMSERRILWKHGLRNAGLTTLTFMGVVTAGLITGSVLVETVFVWPGTGRLLIESIEIRDFPVVQGLILLYGAVYIGVNLLVDVLYTVLNPRLRTA